MFCKYSDIFGKPNTGSHKYRLFDVAIVDLVLTIIVAYLLSLSLSYSFGLIFAWLMVLSIVFHKLFCVETTVVKLLNKAIL